MSEVSKIDGNSNCTPKYFEEPTTDGKIKKLKKYLDAGWKWNTALSQCGLSTNNKSKAEIMAKLREIGHEQVRGNIHNG